MARQYIDPQEYLDKIAALEKQVAELRSGEADSESGGSADVTALKQKLEGVTAERDALKVENAELQQKLDSAIAALPSGTPESPESKSE